MVKIIKKTTPKSLVEYKNAGNISYNDFPNKFGIYLAYS